ncbi:MAG: hypothetical protein C4524_03965 [Candidatus Zixiibacteriota bacterium]|nr:MAG: hypothetical protein C4524_03965 [candidate division Zixibacteria bacterium]
MPRRFTTPTLPLDLLQDLCLDRCVALGLTATGPDLESDRVVEVAAMRLVEGRETESYHTLLRLSGRRPPDWEQTTGLSEKDLAGAPRPAEALKGLLEFIGEDPLVGHDLVRTLGFLKEALRREGLDDFALDRKAADTDLLARVFLPTLPSRSLPALADYFNLGGEDCLRALSQARACAHILLHELSYFIRVDLKAVDLLRRAAEGLRHPSAWIFGAWHGYLMRSAALEGRFKPYQIPFLKDNVIGRLAYRFGKELEEADPEALPEAMNGALVEQFFSGQGRLSQALPGFECRPQQEEMAQACGEIFNAGGVLAVEAGTGVGKSLAYLVPSILWAAANRHRAERVIVSTNTINLQEQLFHKDLPLLVEALPEAFSAVLLKGRGNYLCRGRWETLVTEHPLRLGQPERLALLSLALWAGQTRTGDVTEVAAFDGEGSDALWARLASEPGSCRGKRCQERGRCFYAKARAAAQRTDVVVVNHALLLSDLAADRAPIGPYRALVVDEAHHLERAAAQHLGRELNYWQFRVWTGRMYEVEGLATGLLARIMVKASTAADSHPALPGILNALQEAGARVVELRRVALDFFQNLTAAVRGHLGDRDNGYTPKLRLRDPAGFLQVGPLAQVPLLTVMMELEKLFARLTAGLGEIPLAILPKVEDWREELGAALDELRSLRETFVFYFMPPDGDWVYWTELPRRRDQSALLYAAPLNVADILRDQLFAPLRTAVLTSATLTVADRFHYYLRKVGLAGRDDVRSHKLGSPFDFSRQMRLGLPAFLPSPRQPEFEERFIEMLRDLVKRIPRGTLGLFTSHRALKTAGKALDREIPARSLLVQGAGGNRDQLLRRFRDEPGSVLLGTDSFWEGIDVVGEALELLLVSKLPFEVPSEPLVEARLERLEAEGRDPFMYYTVPEAIIRLRQGVGRLIRSKSDRGAAIICDSRLTQSRYGRAFLESLPAPVTVYETYEAMIRDLEAFFAPVTVPD